VLILKNPTSLTEQNWCKSEYNVTIWSSYNHIMLCCSY